LADNLARLHLRADLVQADVLTWSPPELFDAVLLDAPCSATGTIRRHPDVPHLKRPRDITMLCEAQDRLRVQANPQEADHEEIDRAASSRQIPSTWRESIARTTAMPTTIAEPLIHPESTRGNQGAACWTCTQFTTGKNPNAVPKAANATASHREAKRVVTGGLATCEDLSEKSRAMEGGIVTILATPAGDTPLRTPLRFGRQLGDSARLLSRGSVDRSR